MLGPDTALLFYTSWAEWQQFGNPERERNAIEGRASRTVEVPRCGDEPWGAPGAVLLESPGCVEFRVSGQNLGREVVQTVPWPTIGC